MYRSCADTLLRNLYRWISSPASRLHDPSLKQVRLPGRAAMRLGRAPGSSEPTGAGHLLVQVQLCNAARSVLAARLTQNTVPLSSSPGRAVMQMVQGLMQKLLLQLIAELQKLGATVVHADCSTLILCTGKRNLTAAVG